MSSTIENTKDLPERLQNAAHAVKGTYAQGCANLMLEAAEEIKRLREYEWMYKELE